MNLIYYNNFFERVKNLLYANIEKNIEGRVINQFKNADFFRKYLNIIKGISSKFFFFIFLMTQAIYKKF